MWLRAHRCILRVLGVLLVVVPLAGCGDDRTGAPPVEATSGTDTQTSAEVEAGSLTESAGTTGGEDALAPWYGPWYSLHPSFTLNMADYWGDGGNSLAVTHFELRADGATITSESCLWGWFLRFEYTSSVGDDGVTVLEPVEGVHAFKPHGEIERLYLRPGADCTSLTVVEVLTDGEELDLFSSTGLPLARGELCLEKCAEEQGDWGILTDCGTPVPWACLE